MSNVWESEKWGLMGAFKSYQALTSFLKNKGDMLLSDQILKCFFRRANREMFNEAI